MRSTGATLLVAGALGYATYYYGSMHERHEGATQLAKVTRILTLPSADETERPRVFSPQRPLIAPATDPTAVAVSTPARTAANANSPFATLPAIAPLPAVEAIKPRRGTAALEPAPARPVSTKPTGEKEREELVRNLQKELKRVGCYEGDVDGDWGSGSKRAMRTFTERVNATLPTEAPDYILLTLVRGHVATGVCGKGCPPSQAFDSEGRCVHRAILAQASRRPAGVAEMAVAAKRSEPSGEQKLAEKREADKRDLEKRVAEKREADKSRQANELQKVTLTPRQKDWRLAAAPDPANKGSPTSAAIEPLSSNAPPLAAWRTEVQPPPLVAPLPGRMAIGGPVAQSTQPGALNQPGIGDLRPGALAALDREADQTSTVLAPAVPIEEKTAKEPLPERSERSSAPERSQRQRESRPIHRAPPPRAYAPSRSGNSSRYSSFNRPGAVHNFFFDPRRSF